VVVGLSTTLVSDSNAMIMSFGLPYAFQTRAFRWKNGYIRDLGTLGGPDAMVLGVNESGQIFGNSYTNFDSSPVCGVPDFGFDALMTGAFLWQNGKMTNLGSFGGTCTNAIALNNRGQVVGYSFLAGDAVFHPFRWERGKFVDLGTLGGKQGVAQHPNEVGDIVGWQSLAGNENVIHATLWSHGQITDLGAFEPDQCSVPFAIGTNKLASIDPSTMKVREYTLPEAGARPRRIALAPDGTIYYTDFARGYLGHFDPLGGKLLKEWLSPGGSESEPYGIAITNEGEVWYSESGVKPNTLVRFDPK